MIVSTRSVSLSGHIYVWQTCNVNAKGGLMSSLFETLLLLENIQKIILSYKAGLIILGVN